MSADAYLYLIDEVSEEGGHNLLSVRHPDGHVTAWGFTRESEARECCLEARVTDEGSGVNYIGIKPPPGPPCESEIRMGLQTPLDRLASFLLRRLTETGVEVLVLDDVSIPLTEKAVEMFRGVRGWETLLRRAGGSWRGASFVLFTDLIKKGHPELDRGPSSFGAGKTRLVSHPAHGCLGGAE